VSASEGCKRINSRKRKVRVLPGVGGVGVNRGSFSRPGNWEEGYKFGELKGENRDWLEHWV